MACLKKLISCCWLWLLSQTQQCHVAILFRGDLEGKFCCLIFISLCGTSNEHLSRAVSWFWEVPYPERWLQQLCPSGGHFCRALAKGRGQL